MELKEQFIIAQLKKGDESAYKYVYANHYELLCKFANQLLADAFLAETIVSDTIFHLWEIRKKIQINTSLRAYLLTAVRNRCLNHLALNYRKKETSFSETTKDYEDTEMTPLGRLLAQEHETLIHQSIHKIPERTRLVFTKSRFEHKKYKEIAEELQISVDTVKYHLKKTLAILHVELHDLLTVLLLFYFALS